MGKTRRYVRRDEETDDERRLRIMEQVKSAGRMQTPPPTKVHDTDRNKPGTRRNRRNEKQNLRKAVEEFNNG